MLFKIKKGYISAPGDIQFLLCSVGSLIQHGKLLLLFCLLGMANRMFVADDAVRMLEHRSLISSQ